jgi:hypothetical protein
MYELAKLQRYRISQDGTTLEVFLPNINLQEPIESKRMNKCGLWLEDGRHITAEQRKKAYATIRDIADWTGYLPEEQKEWLKYLHIANTGCKYFSLSTCSIDTAREFINTILDYALREGIALSDFGVDRTDDIGKYLYFCLKHKKCAVCGDKGEIHHVDTIGMGADRRTVDDSEYRKICLCRKHHTQAHTYGMTQFESRYKVYGIVFETD